MPDKAIPIAQRLAITRPVAMTLITPNRLMMLPVKKLGAEHADDMPLDDSRR